MLKNLLTFIFVCLSLFIISQNETLDKVICVVGKYPILLSDLQNAMLLQEKNEEKIDKCKAFEQVLFQKLLMAQADRDSVTVSDAEIENELNKRMNYYINQFGSEEKLEQFYGKRTNVIKDDFRADVQEQLIAQKMQGKISSEGKLSPAEIRAYYNSIPDDSLPLINSEYELQQIVKRPTFSAEAKKVAKEQTEEYRDRVLKGENLSTLARLYSEDPGSAKEGGLITNVFRGQMTPEFEAVAFRLKTGEISHVFETPYGYHFMQLVSRKGDLLDLRHILLIPKMNNSDYYKCKIQLDSLSKAIKAGNITFEDAVTKFSDDKETSQNGGLMVNPMSASTKWTIDDIAQLDQKLVQTINDLNIGETSKAMDYTSYPDNKPGFRIVKLKNRIEPHKVNIKDDYQKLSQMANVEKRAKAQKEWIRRRSKITYIKMDNEYKSCTFQNKWVINN